MPYESQAEAIGTEPYCVLPETSVPAAHVDMCAVWRVGLYEQKKLLDALPGVHVS